MAQVQVLIADKKEQINQATKLFHKFVEELQTVKPIIGYATDIHYICLHKRFHEVTDDFGNITSNPKEIERNNDVIYRYRLNSLEREWTQRLIKLAGLDQKRLRSNCQALNHFIQSNMEQVAEMRKDLIKEYMKDLLTGFRMEKCLKSVLANPSLIMIDAGICLLTYQS